MNEKIVIVFDTSTLRQVVPRSTVYQQLCRLVRNERIEIHVPAIVRREVESQIGSFFVPIKEQAAAAAWLSDGTYKKLVATLAGTTPGTVLAEVSVSVSKLFRDLNITELPFGPAEEVFDLYFGGYLPFGSVKQRKDLPDGFVFTAVRSLGNVRTEQIYFVCADDRLSAACRLLPKVTTYVDIHSVLRLPALLPRPIELFSTYLIDKFQAAIFAMFRDEVSRAISGDTVSKHNAKVDEGWIRSIGDTIEMGFDASDSVPLDDESIEVPFYCVAEIRLVDMAPAPDAGAAPESSEREALVHVEGWANVRWKLEGRGQLVPESASLQRVDSVYLEDEDYRS